MLPEKSTANLVVVPVQEQIVQYGEEEIVELVNAEQLQ